MHIHVDNFSVGSEMWEIGDAGRRITISITYDPIISRPGCLQRLERLFEGSTLLARTFLSEGLYLANQLRRAANSMHANIAEEFGRSTAEFSNYLTRALGSAHEIVGHLEDAESCGYAKASRWS